MEARLYNLKTPMGLVLKEVRVKGVNLVASLPGEKSAKPVVEILEPATFEAFVDAEALKVFLDDRAPGGLRDFEIELVPGKIIAKATATVVIPIRASAVCTLRLEGERQLFVDIESVDLMGVGAKGLVEGQLAKVNPVLDAADLPLDIRLKEVEIVDGAIKLSGTGRP